MTRLLQDRLETEKKNILQEKEVRSWDNRWRGDQAPAGQAGDREEEYPPGEGGKKLGAGGEGDQAPAGQAGDREEEYPPGEGVKELGEVERVTRLLQDRLETEKKNILQEKEVRSWDRWRG